MINIIFYLKTNENISITILVIKQQQLKEICITIQYIFKFINNLNIIHFIPYLI